MNGVQEPISLEQLNQLNILVVVHDMNGMDNQRSEHCAEEVEVGKKEEAITTSSVLRTMCSGLEGTSTILFWPPLDTNSKKVSGSICSFPRL